MAWKKVFATAAAAVTAVAVFVDCAPLVAHSESIEPNSSRPNFVVIFGDDLGFYDTQIYNPNSPTPTIARLASEGLLLNRHYVFRGRFPNRISTAQPDGDHLCSDFLPLNATILSEKLSQGAAYTNHFIGKGHLGYQTMDHLPINRGFASHVGFLAGSELYSHGGGSADVGKGSHDLWQAGAPAVNIVPTMEYATDFYGAQAVKIIEAAGRARAHHLLAPQDVAAPAPFFMYLAIQNVHTPYTLPAPWETHKYPAMWDETYANMLSVMDDVVQNVTNALQHQGLWNNTLVLFSADNGGVTKGNNYPLRGHKHDPWEGGTRATAFLSGGFLPESVRGTQSGDKLVHVSDWYPTFLHLAGLGHVASDNASFSGAYHDIDGVNVWPLLTGENATQPRAVTPTSEVAVIDTSEGASGHWWKLVTLAGQSNYYTRNQSTVMPANATLPCLSGAQPDPPQPGRTDPIVNGACVVCNATHPCLFDILNDPSEQVNVAAAHPDRVQHLSALVDFYQDYYAGIGSLTTTELETNYDKIPDPNAHWKGFLGPCYQRKANTSLSRVAVMPA